jgi:shikimate 5-dehydrogenase
VIPICHENTPDIKGINVTIPYKEEVIAHLYSLSKKAT